MSAHPTRRPTAGLQALLVCLACAGAGAAPPAALAAETLLVAYNSEWPPYSAGEGEAVQGILPDIVDALLEPLGIPVTHHGYPWKRVQKLVQEGTMHAFVTFPSPDRLEYTQSTANVVYTVQMQAVVRRGSETDAELSRDPTIDGLRAHRGCVMLGDGWSTAFYEKHHIEFENGTDTANCLEQVAGGRVDMFIHSAAAVRRHIRLSGFEEVLHIEPQIYDSVPMTLMVSKRVPGQLWIVGALDEEVARMKSDGRYEDLVARVRNAHR